VWLLEAGGELTVKNFTDTWFDRKIAARLVEDENGCLNWQGAKTQAGYGTIRVPGGGGGVTTVHRAAWEHHVGAIGDGLQLDHLCRNPACANVAHLEPVSPRLNTLRGATLAADQLTRTHCPQGHELSGANLLEAGRKRGYRTCRTCHSARARLQSESIRAARKALGYTHQRYVDEFGYSMSVAIEVQRRVGNEESLDGVRDVAPGHGWHGKRTITVEPNTSLTEAELTPKFPEGWEVELGDGEIIARKIEEDSL
jgi:hypothetical protein